LVITFKNISTLLFSIFIIILSCSPEIKESPAKILIGSQTKKYKYIDGKLGSTGVLYERIFFDSQGRDSIVENYDSNGKLFLRTILYYDLLSNKIKSTDFKPDGKLESTTDFIYSNDNLLLEHKRQHINGGYNQGKFFYDNKKRRIKEIWTSKWYINDVGDWYTSEDILLRTYNDKGYCIGVKESVDGKPFLNKKTIFDSVGHIIFEDWGNNFRKFKYDRNGNQIEELSLDENQKLVNRWVSVYDTNNFRIEYITYNSLNKPVEVLKREMIYK